MGKISNDNLVKKELNLGSNAEHGKLSYYLDTSNDTLSDVKYHSSKDDIKGTNVDPEVSYMILPDNTLKSMTGYSEDEYTPPHKFVLIFWDTIRVSQFDQNEKIYNHVLIRPTGDVITRDIDPEFAKKLPKGQDNRRIQFVNGDVYEGGFKQVRDENRFLQSENPEGYGRLTSMDGDYMEGEFVDGDFKKGIEYINGTLTEGQFDNGQTIGPVKITSTGMTNNGFQIFHESNGVWQKSDQGTTFFQGQGKHIIPGKGIMYEQTLDQNSHVAMVCIDTKGKYNEIPFSFSVLENNDVKDEVFCAFNHGKYEVIVDLTNNLETRSFGITKDGQVAVVDKKSGISEGVTDPAIISQVEAKLSKIADMGEKFVSEGHNLETAHKEALTQILDFCKTVSLQRPNQFQELQAEGGSSRMMASKTNSNGGHNMVNQDRGTAMVRQG